jgi:hypothetical protein
MPAKRALQESRHPDTLLFMAIQKDKPEPNTSVPQDDPTESEAGGRARKTDPSTTVPQDYPDPNTTVPQDNT